jgi:hypothetical protein
VDVTITIALPLAPAVFALFMGVLGVALVFYAYKFLASLVVGG